MHRPYITPLAQTFHPIKAYTQIMSLENVALFCHSRKLIIVWVTNIGGGKNFLKIYFKKKIFNKSSLQFSKKILTTFFFSHREKFFSKKHFSLKMHKFTSFSFLCIFLSFSLFLLSFMFIFF